MSGCFLTHSCFTNCSKRNEKNCHWLNPIWLPVALSFRCRIGITWRSALSVVSTDVVCSTVFSLETEMREDFELQNQSRQGLCSLKETIWLVKCLIEHGIKNHPGEKVYSSKILRPPRSHRTRKQLCTQLCMQTLCCCLQSLWTLPLTIMCSKICICLLRGVPRPVWTGPDLILCGTFASVGWGMQRGKISKMSPSIRLHVQMCIV